MVISLNEYKTYADFKTSNSDDKLQPIVDYVNDYIEKFCNTKFSLEETLAERHVVVDGVVVLKNAPVVEILSITVGGVEYQGTYYLQPEEGILEFESNPPNRVAISYSFGYDLPPAGLKIPAFELVTYFNKREFNKTQTIGATGESISFSDTRTIPAHIRAGLELYRVL